MGLAGGSWPGMSRRLASGASTRRVSSWRNPSSTAHQPDHAVRPLKQAGTVPDQQRCGLGWLGVGVGQTGFGGAPQHGHGLVQHQHGVVGQQRPGDRHALPFSRRRIPAPGTPRRSRRHDHLQVGHSRSSPSAVWQRTPILLGARHGSASPMAVRSVSSPPPAWPAFCFAAASTALGAARRARLFLGDALQLYSRWPSSVVIVSDGAYGPFFIRRMWSDYRHGLGIKRSVFNRRNWPRLKPWKLFSARTRPSTARLLC